MCGIAGIISKKKSKISEEELKAMTNIISHRGPDAEGFHIQSNFGFGHRRLSIIDLSIEGNQPMFFDDYVITYNGEIYNYLEIKEELEKEGYIFKTKSDTEVILAAYHYWGEDCVTHFNGMWAFAIYDPRKNIIFCSRDRFGIKPFYYTEIGSNFYFASEIKQFTIVNDWKAKGNTQRILDSLLYGMFDYCEETLFKDVYQLRGGHNLIIDLATNKLSTKQWYFLKKIDQKKDSKFINKSFFNNFRQAVKLRLRADVKTGSCLSGGLDSSSIVCMMHDIYKEEKLESKDIETISSCFEDKKFDEQEYVDEVIGQTKITGHKIFPELSDFLAFSSELVWIQDEPFMSTSIYAQYKVFEGAKKHGIKVMLDGQGADEILGGYIPIAFELRLRDLLSKFNLKAYFKEINAIKSIHNISKLELIQRSVIPVWLRNTFHKSNSLKFVNPQVLKSYKGFKRKYPKGFDKFSEYMLMFSNIPKLLHYEDRNSMIHSIESRVPFLDVNLVEQILNLDSRLKVNNGKTKFILRTAMKKILPHSIVNRHDKLGFVTPESKWITQNRPLIRKELTKALEILDPIINQAYILELFKSTNELQIGSIFFKCIIFAKWIKRFKIDLGV